MEALEQLSLTNIALTPLLKDTCAEIYHVTEDNTVSIQIKGLTKNQCYQTNCERVLTYLTRFRSSKLLVDFRELMMMNTEDRCWTEGVWQHQLAQAGVARLAILMPDNLFAALSINKMIDNIKQNAYWECENFTDESKAYNWLIQ